MSANDAWTAAVSRIDSGDRDHHVARVQGRFKPSNGRRHRGRPLTNHTEHGADDSYLIDVIASNVADVVTSIGGWLFDRSMAGWRVNMHTADDWDVRPLHILGIGTMPFDWDRESLHAQALAISAEMYVSHPHVRDRIVTAFDDGLMELVVWDDSLPLEGPCRLEDMTHQLSTARRGVQGAVPSGSGDSAPIGEPHRIVSRGPKTSVNDHRQQHKKVRKP